jgi:hypothetical protein
MKKPVALSALSREDRNNLVSDIISAGIINDNNKSIVAEWLLCYDELVSKLKSPHVRVQEIKKLLGIFEDKLKKLQQTR